MWTGIRLVVEIFDARGSRDGARERIGRIRGIPTADAADSVRITGTIRRSADIACTDLEVEFCSGLALSICAGSVTRIDPVRRGRLPEQTAYADS